MAAVLASEALLLIGHGSIRHPDAGQALFTHANTLRGTFAEVGVGFLNGPPSAAEALIALRAPTVHVVPFFMEDGYFTRVAVPRALAGVRQGSLRISAAIGTHAGMAALIEAHVVRRCPDPAATAVVLVGHGSARAPGRPMALHEHAERLRLSGRFASVHCAFLEEAPFAAAVLAAAPGPAVAVVGVFAGEGMHARDDLPAIVDAERTRRGGGIGYLGSIGADPAIAALILEHVTRIAQ